MSVLITLRHKLEARRTYDQIAEDDLQDLGLQTGAARKQLLEDLDHEMTKRCADESTICSHLGDPRVDIVAMLALVPGDVRCDDFL